MTRGLRVEIWTTAEARNNKNWNLTKQASPGTLSPFMCLSLMKGNLQDVEDLLGNMDLTTSPVVLAVKLQVKGDQKVIGVAFVDASVREIGVSEFIDNDVYSNFEVDCPLHFELTFSR
jgi:DNA mismatch repair protein MSH2